MNHSTHPTTQDNSANTSEKSFDFLVFIGRFQPFHNGHRHVILEALQRANHVIILVGSSFQARTIRNPWSFNEREHFINLAFSPEQQRSLTILPLMDEMYNDQNWITRVQQTVNGVICRYPPKVNQTARVGLIGHNKDETSYYLSLFPQWNSIEVHAYKDISATPLREQYFLHGEIHQEFPDAVKIELSNFKSTENYQSIADEWQFILSYHKAWACAPYPPVFVTVDAVVIQTGHILLVERKGRPGKGQLALPGGFLDADEKLQAAAIRELCEETRINLPVPLLQSSMTRSQVFDHPNRSMRGRTITHAYLFELQPDSQGLPPVEGDDDARHAFWLPLSELNPECMFEDHFHIIRSMLG